VLNLPHSALVPAPPYFPGPQDWPASPSGFGSLTLSSNPAYNYTTTMYAIGYLEGVLTQSRIKQQVRTVRGRLRSGGQRLSHPVPMLTANAATLPMLPPAA
jgi:hypothetical protein